MGTGTEKTPTDDDTGDQVAELQSITSLSLASWPLVHHPLSSGISALIVLCAAFFFGLLAASFAFGLLAFVVLALVMWRLWLPVRYRISANGIMQTVCGRDFHIAWRAVGEVRFSANGCVISRASFSSPVASLQSIVLDYAARPDQKLTRQEVETVMGMLIQRYAGQTVRNQDT